MLKVDVWSDYVCPFCYIGKRELENAINAAGLQGQVDVNFKAYQLDPGVLSNDERTSLEGLAKKFNTTIEEAEKRVAPLVERAKTVGLDFDFSKMKVANTLKAHRLAKWAEQQGKGKAFSELVLKAHFLDNEKISTHEVLADLAEQVGLSRKDALAILEGSEYASEVLQDIDVARQIGVQGVPFFVLNDKYAISGAQPQSLFEEALLKLADENRVKPALKVLSSNNDGICGDDGCEI